MVSDRPAIKAFIAPDVGDDEHLVLRLGWAAVHQWANLPERAKELIRGQAGFTELPKHPVVQLSEQLDIFLEKQTGEEQ